MTALPRVVVAAPGTGQGKTTVATGLMAALAGRGLEVSGHKVGPDFIDPGHHALATGRPGRNLDPHLVGEERVVPLLLHGAAGADVAVVEGVMGLHDGRIGTDGYASTAHVARLTRTPVVLVVDVARTSRSAGAVVAGMSAYDPHVDVRAVVLNRAGSARNVAEVERAVRLPVVGVLPHDDTLGAPSRHLGLVPAGERDATDLVDRWARAVARHVDLDAVLGIARTAAPLPGPAWDPRAEVAPVGGGPLVAVARGRAFTFGYAETEELLTAAGCRVVGFDPLTDPALPDGTRGLYLGGGFPELHLPALAANRPLLQHIAHAVRSGLPTVAECGGYLYLLEGVDGTPLAGVLPGTAGTGPRTVLRYPTATAPGDHLLARAGERVKGHEFHRTRPDERPDGPDGGATAGWAPAWVVEGEPVGAASATLHASYLHLHWAGSPWMAERFATAAAAASPVPPPTASPPSASGPHPPSDPFRTGPDDVVVPDAPVGDPLTHHGDVEVADGLLDLAVNVHPGPRPDWLEAALAQGVRASTAYPDATAATAAVAALHGRPVQEVLVTAGAAEAFELVARARRWVRPVVVHPQFTEPHAALLRAGHDVRVVHCRAENGFALDPGDVPHDADLVVLGNPTNPTGVLHPAATVRALTRPGRTVVVDEAFMDVVPDPAASLADGGRHPADDGLLVIRSLTKHWSIPGVRVGYVVGDAAAVAALRRVQVPWSVSVPALHAAVACTGEQARQESTRRAEEIGTWRRHLVETLTARGVPVVPSAASFVLAQVPPGTRTALRRRGVAVRRADTFPGLDDGWVRIAVRPATTTDRVIAALDAVLPGGAR